MTTDADIRAQAADLIDGALDVLAERGWCQGEFEAPDGRVCLSGALFVAAARLVGDLHDGYNEDTFPFPLLRFARGRVLMEAGWFGIPSFNDAAGRSVEDVTLTLKRAAHTLRTEVA